MNSADVKNHVISTKSYIVTSGYGWRDIGKGREMHYGLDIVDSQRREKTQDVYIIAIADGVCVEYIEGQLVGHTVALWHEGEIDRLSRYQHMKAGSVRVNPGDKVVKGQILGVMGTTGYSTGIHLHLATKENSRSYSTGSWTDPTPYLTGAKQILTKSGIVATPQNKAAVTPTPTHDFKVGDTIKIKQATQRYVGGQFMPTWVKDNKYTVEQVGREKLLLKEIMSWVYEADVDLVKHA